MRIIAGKARGRRLRSPADSSIRPTEDRVREAIFSMIGDLQGAIVVDCFAGSGALGLEALSRGATKAYFFDISKQSIQVINENIIRVGVEDRASVSKIAFHRGLQDIVEGSPDLFFVDPPYKSGQIEVSLNAMLEAQAQVTEGALVVVEASRDEEIPVLPGFLVEDQRIYGSTQVVFLRRAELLGQE